MENLIAKRRRIIMSDRNLTEPSHSEDVCSNESTTADPDSTDEICVGFSMEHPTVERTLASSIEEFFENPVLFIPREDFLAVLIEDETVLTHAVKIQKEAAVQGLIEIQADPNQPNRRGVTPISAAAHKGSVGIMKRLIEAGAQVNALNTSGSTALIQASHFGHFGAVKILLDNNAAADFANLKGTTALMRASQEGHVDISKLLIQADADVNRKNHEGMNALMLASQRGHADMVKLLIKNGAQMDEQTSQGSTALMLACKRGHEKCVEALVTMGAEIFMRDGRGRTAKDTAMRRNHTGLLRWLDTQVQIQCIQAQRQLTRSMCLQEFRMAFDQGKLRLSDAESKSQRILSAMKIHDDASKNISFDSARSSSKFEAKSAEALAAKPLLERTSFATSQHYPAVGAFYPVYPAVVGTSESVTATKPDDISNSSDGNSSQPETSIGGWVGLGDTTRVCGAPATTRRVSSMEHSKISEGGRGRLDLGQQDGNMGIHPAFLQGIVKPRQPGYAEWEWPLLLMRCMALPSGVFELICDMLPLPRIWHWSLNRLKQRCKLDANQASKDICVTMDEILADTNIFAFRNQMGLLIRLNRCPQAYPLIQEKWGMSLSLIERVNQWADVQSLLGRAGDGDFMIKNNLLKAMLNEALQLFKWQRDRSSSVRMCAAVAGTTAGAAVIAGLGIVYAPGDRSVLQRNEKEECDVMDATDAGENASEGDIDGLMDQDTETEQIVGPEADDGQDDSDAEAPNGPTHAGGHGVGFGGF